MIDKEKISDMLHHFKEVLSLNTKITGLMVSDYHNILKKYPFKVLKMTVEGIISGWDKRYMPSISLIKEVCEGNYSPENGTDPYCKAKKERENAEFYALKEKYKHDLHDLKQRILTGQPLTDKQQKAFDIVMPYMDSFFGKRDLKKELSSPKGTPYNWSFAGIYRQAAEGLVKGMAGNNKGNIGGSMRMFRK